MRPWREILDILLVVLAGFLLGVIGALDLGPRRRAGCVEYRRVEFLPRGEGWLCAEQRRRCKPASYYARDFGELERALGPKYELCRGEAMAVRP